MKKNTHIKKLSNVLHLGLGSFLIIGLSGCNVDKNCSDDNMKYLSQREQLECKDKKTYNTNPSGSSTHAGFFSSQSSNLS